MSNKGFTLIELVGTIVILSFLLLIISPVITRSIRNGVETADKQVKSNIELAAKNWASDNKGFLPKVQNEVYKVKISDLQNEGYLDDVKLPSDLSDINTSCVFITKVNSNDSVKNMYKYEYRDSEC